MEQQVNNVINFGIGCVKAMYGGYAEITGRLRSGVSSIIQDGEKSKDETALKIREIAYKATDFFRRGTKTQKATRAA